MPRYEMKWSNRRSKILRYKQATPSVGIIGLGIMGSAMAANLMAGAFRVVGYDVLERRRRDHRRAGGEVARSARDLATRSPIVISSLPAPKAFLAVAEEL